MKIRPIDHWKASRIRAPIAICFTAFALLRILKYRSWDVLDSPSSVISDC
ncbi:MAG: hypothetical protein OXC64_00375 [Flavobacteriaceae bacterium]|nr:hypothetical protein [Flavobacteriaceae bacterium]